MREFNYELEPTTDPAILAIDVELSNL